MKTFIVLGMHRSATSLTAKGLFKSGVNMGRTLLGAGRGNEYGHYEDVEFLHLNERILHTAGGTWDNPPSHDAIMDLRPVFDNEIKELLKRKYVEASEQGMIGWKDPRTTLTIWLYIDFLINPHFIVNFRNKMEVARSLQVRDGFPISKGFELAEKYNQRLLDFLNYWNYGYLQNGINHNTDNQAGADAGLLRRN